MTKDRARKQAARQRAAVTGERYVIAARAVAMRAGAVEESPPDGGRLHALTHRMPGVPAHVAGGLQGAAGQRPVTSPQPPRRRRHEHGEPRVLVAWQDWIAQRVGAGGR